MKITYNNTTIEFWNFELPKQITVSLSGGVDSAAALYLTCLHFPEIEIIPYTACDENAPKDADAAQEISNWMKKTFPTITFHDHKIFNFNDRNEEYVRYKECKRSIKGNKKYKKLNLVQMSKILQLNMISNQVKNLYPDSVRLDGMTANPPPAVMAKNNFLRLSESRRTFNQAKSQYDKEKQIYQPWINVDKKFVADIYKQHDLINTLFPITRSCIGTASETENFTKECHNCFWCYEKKWAFDLDWNK